MRIRWPATEERRNIWMQHTSPTLSGVRGYVSISTPFLMDDWGGLERSSHTSSYLDGSVDHSWWWYAIGSNTAYHGGLPGGDRNVEQRAELWIRPTDTCQDATSGSTCSVACKHSTPYSYSYEHEKFPICFNGSYVVLDSNSVEDDFTTYVDVETYENTNNALCAPDPCDSEPEITNYTGDACAGTL